jgi:hypothetical protein
MASRVDELELMAAAVARGEVEDESCGRRVRGPRGGQQGRARHQGNVPEPACHAQLPAEVGLRPWLELLLIEQWKANSARQPWCDTRGISTGGHGGALGGELGSTASLQRGLRLERLSRRRRRRCAPEPAQQPSGLTTAGGMADEEASPPARRARSATHRPSTSCGPPPPFRRRRRLLVHPRRRTPRRGNGEKCE